MISSRHHTTTIVGIEVLAGMVLGLAIQAGPFDASAHGDMMNVGGGPRAVELRGNWIVRAYPGGTADALLKLEVVEEKLTASVLAVGHPEIYHLKESRIDDLRIDDGSLTFTLRLGAERQDDDHWPVKLILPEGQKVTRVLRGSMGFGQAWYPVVLERTERADLEVKDADTPAPGFQELRKATEANGIEAKKAGLEEIIRKYQDSPIAISAAQALAYELAGNKAPLDEVRRATDQTIRLAAPYGRDLELFENHFAAWRLTNTEGFTDLAVGFARKTEAMLRPSDPASRQASVLKTLAAALRKAGRKDESGTLRDRIATLDEALDREYLRSAPTLKVLPHEARKGSSRHVALIEMFTGATCRPCVRADTAFDALLSSYQPDDVVLLEYHLHIPGFDALCNEASEARARYYGAFYTPFLCLDGKDQKLIERPAITAADGYEMMRKRIDGRLKSEAQAQLRLDVNRKDQSLHIKARVDQLKKTGDQVRLRFVLVEGEVRYDGGNGVRLNHHVPRAFPGGVEGFALTSPSSEHSVALNLAGVIENLDRYLDRLADKRDYPDNERPTRFGRLLVVALIQDDTTKEILQAAQATVADSGR